MALAGQKKKQNKRLFEELQCFFLCFFEISEFLDPKLEGEGTDRIQMLKVGNAG